MVMRLGLGTGAVIARVSRGAGFIATIMPDEAIPAGTLVELRITAAGYAATWVADTSSGSITWTVPAADTATVPDGSWAEIWVTYDGVEPIRWLCGPADTSCQHAGGILASGSTALPGVDGTSHEVLVVPGPEGKPGSVSGTVPRTVSTLVAATVINGHMAITTNASGQAIPASSTDPTHAHRPLWVALGSALAGGDVQAVSSGEITEPSWSWTPGVLVYLGTSGALVQDPPRAVNGDAFHVVIGYAASPTSLQVERGPSIILI